MYQTVGQDAIELVAKALDVPLYRKVISGSAVHQGAEYGPRTAHGLADLEGDETEDLYHLLSTVLVCHGLFSLIVKSKPLRRSITQGFKECRLVPFFPITSASASSTCMRRLASQMPAIIDATAF